ncbi:hypothetical protein C8J57DRAFT_596812 [Mycena rebaudengoi]|nr:hypothetical protein C8J57DRAFT_596812 [Mycena rebaudengoi]
MSITALALCVGLGARILLDQLTRSGDPTFREYIVHGLWLGTAFYYATTKNKDFALPAAIVVVAKLFIDFTVGQDATRGMVTLLGIALGFCGTDLLSRWIDNYNRQGRKRQQHHGHRQRPGHTRRSEGDERRTPRRDTLRRAVSDITSVDTNSLLFGRDPTMTPLDREVAALRARASLADSERRRYKEERKWAIEVGNEVRAKEMSWQVKRYSALMKSFHREADDKILEVSNRRQTYGSKEQSQVPEQHTRRGGDTAGPSDLERRRSMRVNVR